MADGYTHRRERINTCNIYNLDTSATMCGVKTGDKEGIPGLEVSRRELGVAYLAAVGLLFLAFGLYEVGVVMARAGPPDLGRSVVLAVGVVLSASLLAIGGWLYRSPLSDEHALAVSRWGALGLTVPTAVVAVAMASGLAVGPTAPELTVALATGGVVGSLYGTVRALEAERDRVDALYRRNLVLQRVFRHNIRNGMNVVRGYAQLLSRSDGADHSDLAEKIDREAHAVVDLADVTRDLTDVERVGNLEPVDLVPLVTDLTETLSEYYPEASFELELPETAWVAADGSVEIAIWHLLEFAIHRSRDGTVAVSLETGDDGTVLSVADDGRPLASEAIAALEREEEAPLEHLDGMDLWVVKWLVGSLGGELTVENVEDGVRVRVAFQSRSSEQGEGG